MVKYFNKKITTRKIIAKNNFIDLEIIKYNLLRFKMSIKN